MKDYHQKIHQHYHNKRVLITGAAGYIGSHLVNALSDIPCRIVRMSRKKLTPNKNTTATFYDLQADFLEFDDWKNLISSVDYIFHLGAQTGIKIADDFPVRDAQINIVPLLKILEASKHIGEKILILAGSATQYGFQDKLPVNEKVLGSPITLYDLNKSIAEQYLSYFSKNHWIRGTCLRLANVYGPGIMSSDNSRGVINQVIRNALSGKNIATFDGGEFIRDYIYVYDVVNAFLLAGAYIDQLKQSHYVIGTGVGTTIKAAFQLVAKCVEQKTGAYVSLMNCSSPFGATASDHRHFVADSAAFMNITQWRPQYALEDGIYQTINAFQQGMIS